MINLLNELALLVRKLEWNLLEDGSFRPECNLNAKLGNAPDAQAN